MKRFFTIGLIPLTLTGLIVLGWWLLRGVQVDVLHTSGVVADQQRMLMIFTVLLSAAVVIPVFIMLGVFAWRYRRGRTSSAQYSPEWAESRKLEMLWWGIPILIIMVLSVVTWQTSHSLDPYRAIDSHHETIEVQVVALQWKWLFLYPSEGIATVNELPIPAQNPIHFTIAADAPMSAFWVPALGSQIYSMNGMSTQLNLVANTPGDYRGYNTNINGKGYADMTFTVKARSSTDYMSWLTSARQSPHALDMATYEQLAQPSVMKEPKTYRLTDRDLYHKIIAKYMPGHTMQSGTSHHNMEGM